METKLWQKTQVKNPAWLEEFTVGSDKSFDMLLAPHDVRASMAHANMLSKTGLITEKENLLLQTELQHILHEIEEGHFTIDEHMEDIHSQIEFILVQKLGDTGKKIHTARSRNDQVLTAVKLFIR